MKRKVFIALGFVGVLIVLGFLREFIFVNTNSILYSKFYNENYPVHSFFNFFKDKSYNFIYISKWFLTFLFILMYFYSQVLTAKFLLKENILRKWFFFFYLFLVILSVITFAVGWLAGNLNQGYIFSRLFLGILQSPLPIMFLLPVYFFTKKLNQHPDSYRD